MSRLTMPSRVKVDLGDGIEYEVFPALIAFCRRLDEDPERIKEVGNGTEYVAAETK